jgi:PAS domain-containing protein
MRPLDFIAPPDRERVGAAMRAVFEQGAEMAVEADVVDRAGNAHPTRFAESPLRMGGRNYLIGIARDISARKQTEQEIARAKERLDLALTGSRLALWDWDLERGKVYFNESWASILGRGAARVDLSRRGRGRVDPRG